MTITFCGHGNIFYGEDIREKLYLETEKLIAAGADKFLLGGYGNFDTLAALTVKSLKGRYPHIHSILVIPYINKYYSTELYDYSIYPPIEETPPRFAIIKRNEWMIDMADFLISHIEYNSGGASRTLAYAQKKDKHIIFV